MEERASSSSLDDLSLVSFPETSLPDVESLMDDLLENTSLENERQVSCMDRKEQWALRLLRKWSTKNQECFNNVIKDCNENFEESFEPEEILLKGSLSAVDNLLSSFLVGVRQNKCGKQYSADSLRQVIMAIQRYLRRHERFVSLLTDPQFSLLQASIALEAVDRLSNSTCRKMNKTQVAPISNTDIDSLWNNHALGFDDPAVLIDTLIFYIGLNFGLTSGHSLRNVNLGQNIFFKLTLDATCVITYKAVIKTGSSPARTIEVDIAESSTDEKSLHYIFSTYLSYRPEEAPSEGPLFLQPCAKYGSTAWYSTTPMGKDSLSKTLQRIIRRAGLPPDSIHSSQLKMAAAVRLASSGQPHQTIKQLTGFNESQYENHPPEETEQSRQTAKRTVEDTESDNSFILPPPKTTKISEADESLQVVPYAAMATPSTILSVPVNTVKLLGDVLPQKIKVTSVMDGIFLNADRQRLALTPTYPLPPWLEVRNATVVKGKESGPCKKDLYKGFVMDMLNSLCDKAGVEFELDVTPDNRFGIVQDGKWTGVIGQVQRGEADLAGTPLTITSARYEAVDFCHPFYTATMCVLYTRTSQLHAAPFLGLRDVLNSKYRVCAYLGGLYNQLLTQKNALTAEILEKVRTTGMIFDSLREATTAMETEDDIALLISKEFAELTVRNRPQKFAMLETGCLTRLYAFATPKGSPLCRKISRHVMELMEMGKVEELFHKWWFRSPLTS